MKALPKSKAKTAYGLLSEVAKLIVAEPKRYDQRNYLLTPDGPNASMFSDFPACGTIGCVAGWVVTLKAKRGRRTPNEDVCEVAADLLGLHDSQVNGLFGMFTVPGLSQTAIHASNGASHIRRFQKAHAAQLKAKKV